MASPNARVTHLGQYLEILAMAVRDLGDQRPAGIGGGRRRERTSAPVESGAITRPGSLLDADFSIDPRRSGMENHKPRQCDAGGACGPTTYRRVSWALVRRADARHCQHHRPEGDRPEPRTHGPCAKPARARLETRHLWRRQRRAPNLIAGIGFISQGPDSGSYYRPRVEADHPHAGFIFEGSGGRDSR